MSWPRPSERTVMTFITIPGLLLGHVVTWWLCGTPPMSCFERGFYQSIAVTFVWLTTRKLK
jgi:hypothetical protein